MEVSAMVAGEHFGEDDAGNLGRPFAASVELGQPCPLAGERGDAAAVEYERQALRRRRGAGAEGRARIRSAQRSASSSSSAVGGPTSASSSVR